MALTDTLKGWLLVATTITSVSLQAIIGFSDLAALGQSLRFFYLALCALLLGGALLYWAATSHRRPLETTALLALLAGASTAMICISTTYHNVTEDTRHANGRVVYTLRGATTAVDVDVVATTSAGSVEPLFYHLDTGNNFTLPASTYYELDNHVVVKGFKRPYVLTVWYALGRSADAPVVRVAAPSGTLLSMPRVRMIWRRTIITGVLLWIAFSAVAVWLSSRWSPLKPSLPFDFQPQPTPTEGTSSTP